MSKSANNLGKPLAGIYTLAPSITDIVAAGVASSINNGSTIFSNITITGGSIDGVVIGQNNPVVLNATTITSGSPGGVGYSVCFYGNIIGDSACWIPTIGQWNIQGDLLVRDISDLGDLRISGNTISSTLSNGSIFLSPNISSVNAPGPGYLEITSGIKQTTINGDIKFNTTNGEFTLTTSKDNTLTSTLDTSINTSNGHISLVTGTAIPNYNINMITTGTLSCTITTSVPNTLQAGDSIKISGSNSTPSIDGTYTIVSVLSTSSFTITPNTTITASGSDGNVIAEKNIYLTASDNIYVPTNVPIVFGNNSSTTEPSIVSDGSITTLTSPEFIIQGNLTVRGTTIQSNIVNIDDPVFNVGGDTLYPSSDIMDRGVSFQYYKNGTTNNIGFFGRNNGTGCFTYIPDATEVSNNIFTGTPGCATFGALTISSLNLPGTATISTINTCNITCPAGNLSISSTNTTVSGILNVCNITCPAGNLTLNSVSTTISGTTNITNLNVTGTVTGISLNEVQQMEHITVATNVNLNPGATTNMTFINTSGTSDVYNITQIPAGNYSGPITISCLNNLSAGNSITISGVNITGVTLTGNYNVVSATNASFVINFTGLISTAINNLGTVTVNATGILLPPTGIDGFEKKILCSSLLNGVIFSLKCPSGTLLDPQTGSTVEKFIDFEYPAQSAYLIYDNVNGYYIPVAVNACVHT